MGELALVTVLLDPDDDAAVTTALLQLHAPAGGVAVIHPTPSSGRQTSLAHDLLAALGHPVAQLGPEGLGGSERAWRAARAWMTADPPRALVLLRAHTLTPASLQPLLTLRPQSGTSLLLVCHTRTLPPALTQLLDGIPHQVLTDLPAAINRHALDIPAVTGPPDDGRADTCPARLPQSKLPMARLGVYSAEAYRRLPPHQFAQFDTHYRYGMDAALAHLRNETGGTSRGQFLSATTWDSPTRLHTYARIRGMQAGFLWHGRDLLIRAPLRQLCGPGLTSVPFTLDIATRIRAQAAHPLVAAALAITYFTGIDAVPRSYLSLEAIAPGGATVTISHHESHDRIKDVIRLYLSLSADYRVGFHVPPLARPFLIGARTFLLEHPNAIAARPAAIDTKLTSALRRCQIPLPHRPYQPRSRLYAIAGTWQLHATAVPFRDPIQEPGHDVAVQARDVGTPAPAASRARYDPGYTGPPSLLDPTPNGTTSHLNLIESYLTAGHIPQPAATPDLDDLLFALRLTPRPSPLPWIPPNQRRRWSNHRDP